MDVERVLMVTCIPAMRAGEPVSVRYPEAGSAGDAEAAVVDASGSAAAGGSGSETVHGDEPVPVSLIDAEAPPSSFSGVPVVPVRPAPCSSLSTVQAACVDFVRML